MNSKCGGPKQEKTTPAQRKGGGGGGDRYNWYIKTFTVSVSDPQIPKTVSRLYV